MKWFDRLHESYVHQRRVRVLTRHLHALIPENGTVLDVGCGDGLLAHRLQGERGDIRIEGVEVLVRTRTFVAVSPFDGKHLPFPDKHFDAVMFVDVLHHSHDMLILLQEAARVARKVVLIKDHLREGWAARSTLTFMDRAANAKYGIDIPCHYLTGPEWRDLFRHARLTVCTWESRLRLYPPPFEWIFGRSLHVVASLQPEER